MKTSTQINKLNELLGIKAKAEEVTAKVTGRVVGITEEEIQEFREIQGIVYFLKAPTLFQAKLCGHCGEAFLVSRKYVAYCSYTCIRKSLNEVGIEWKKGKDLEALVADNQVYDGNEPLWIRSTSLLKLREALQFLSNNFSEEDLKLSSATQKEFLPTGSSIVDPHTTTDPPLSSSVGSTTSPSQKGGKTSSRKKKPKRKFT